MRLVITSATMDVKLFYDFFKQEKEDNVAVLNIVGKQYPGKKKNGSFYLTSVSIIVQIQYLKEPCANYITKSLETVLSIHQTVTQF